MTGITIQHAQRTAFAIVEQFIKADALYKELPSDQELELLDDAETLESIANMAVSGEGDVLEYSENDAVKIILDSLVKAYPAYATEQLEDSSASDNLPEIDCVNLDFSRHSLPGITIQHAQRTAFELADQMIKTNSLFKVLPNDLELEKLNDAETLESIAYMAISGEGDVLEYTEEEALRIIFESLVKAYPDYEPDDEVVTK